MELNTILNQISLANESWILLLPVILMAFDILTGISHAWASRHLKSYKMREGLNRKFGELSILILGEVFTFALKLPKAIIVFASFYIMLMEAISICENFDKMGIWVPKFIKNFLHDTKEKIQNGTNDGKEEEKK